MDNDVNVSIIVPIYNVEQYLSVCLDSLLHQTLKQIEVLLINDGTKDSSDVIAKEYAIKYPNLFHYFEKKNGGLSDARNFALPYAKGEYIAFVDSDDYVAPEMYEKLYKKAKLSDANVVECEFMYVYGRKNISVHFPQYDDIKSCLINAYPNAWNKIYKREWILSLGVVFPKGLWHEDIEFFFKIMPFVGHVPITIHEPLYYYRQRDESIMNRPDRRILDLHKIYANIYKFYLEKNLFIEYKDVIEYKYLRTTCCNFLKRMLKIKDKQFRSNVIDDSWSMFTTACPNWHNNIYLKNNTIINVYLRMMSPSFLKLLKLLIR